jgi:DhnA family fructose-bisphosphate aldolase class Ia
MSGKDIRLGRLFSGSSNAVIVAVDHGQTFGPTLGLEDFPAVTGTLGEADGVLLSPWMTRFVTPLFARRNAPLVINRLNWSTRYCYPWGYTESETVPATSVRTAVSLGADVVLAALILQTGSERREAENVRIFMQFAAEAHELGIPIIGEAFPPPQVENDKSLLHAYVKIASRIACECGADLIKTFYTGDRFPEVVQGTPIPILTLGAEKMNTERQALELAARSIRDGARGVVFGRNVFQAQNPANFLKGLKAVVKDGVKPADAVAQFGLH